MHKQKLLLQDRNILICGAANHFGASMATSLTENGANVIIADKETKAISSLIENINNQKELYDHFGRAINLDYDLMDPHSVKELFQRSAEYLGGVDGVIDNNLYLNQVKIDNAAYLDELDKHINYNLKSSILLCKTSYDFLKDKRKSSILFLMPESTQLGLEAESLLAATKAGLQAFIKSAIKEFNNSKISMNCIITGPTESYLQFRNANESISNLLEEYKKSVPNSDIVNSTELANCMRYFLTPEANILNGQSLYLNQFNK